MSYEPTSISSLIDQWKTIGEFAAEVGCGYEAARQMRKRESIAPRYWPKVISASKARGIKGVSYEWLTKMRLEPLREPEKEAAE